MLVNGQHQEGYLAKQIGKQKKRGVREKEK